MRIIYFQILALALFLFYCSDNPNGDEQENFELGKTFSINYGEILYQNALNLSIKFDTLVSDSRCPVDVVCVWEGEAEVKLKFSVNATFEDFTLHTNKNYFNTDTTLIAYNIELIDLLPYPHTELPHLMTENEVIIIISKE